MQDLGEYFHQETKDNTKKIKSATGPRAKMIRRHSTHTFTQQSNRERLEPGRKMTRRHSFQIFRPFNRESFEDLSSVEDLGDETELSVLDLILTCDYFVLGLRSETGETIGTVTVVNGEETML